MAQRSYWEDKDGECALTSPAKSATSVSSVRKRVSKMPSVLVKNCLGMGFNVSARKFSSRTVLSCGEASPLPPSLRDGMAAPGERPAGNSEPFPRTHCASPSHLPYVPHRGEVARPHRCESQRLGQLGEDMFPLSPTGGIFAPDERPASNSKPFQRTHGAPQRVTPMSEVPSRMRRTERVSASSMWVRQEAVELSGGSESSARIPPDSALT